MASELKVRLDKWLWAARFFKTRSIAVDAITGGKVRYDGETVKAAKEVRVGAVLNIRRSGIEYEVIVMALSTQRRSATEAAVLYQETPSSIQQRERLELFNNAEHGVRDRGTGRPTKRDGRLIKKLKGGF